MIQGVVKSFVGAVERLNYEFSHRQNGFLTFAGSTPQ